MRWRFNDLTGKRFDHIVAQWPSARALNGGTWWLCICDCGAVKSIRAEHLRSSRTKSCGCLKTERWRQFATKHGLHRTAEYTAWQNMRARCLNENHKRFRDWGGRGISICERWNDPVKFIADMGARPSPEHSVDRINNDGNYEPGNCRWATAMEQARNRGRNASN
jgi:hypothetical protein